MYLLSTVWVGIEMKTVCTSGIKNSASQTCTQCPPAEQLILLLLPVFSKETKNVVRARSATSRRIVHTYPTKTMHYASCITPTVLCLLSCPTVLICSVQSSPFILCVFVSKIRSENKFAILFDSGLNFGVARLRGWAAEEELGIFLGGVLRMEGVDVKRWLG